MKKVLAITMVVFMFVVVFSAFSFAEEADVTIHAGFDTYVDMEKADSPMDPWFLSIADMEGKHRSILIKFDVWGIEGEEIESITLQLTESDMAGQAEVPFKVFKASNEWEDQTVTWNTMPDVDMDTVLGTWDGSAMENQQVISIDIDPALLSDGDDYYSIAIIADEGLSSDDASFGALGTEDPAVLLINLKGGAPATGDAGMISLFGAALVSGISGIAIYRRKRTK